MSSQSRHWMDCAQPSQPKPSSALAQMTSYLLASNPLLLRDTEGEGPVPHKRKSKRLGETVDMLFRKEETVNDTPVEWVCDIAKRFIAQGDEVAFFSARNESEREVTEKQISEWIKENPGATQPGNSKNGILLKMLEQTVHDDDEPEHQRNVEKVIKKVAKSVVIDK